MWLIRAALRRPITILVAVIAVALTAVFAVSRMRADIFPDLDLPVIYVAQPYGGMSPAQMEGYITYYYEYHFLYVNGIESVESKSIQNTSLLKLTFHAGTDMAEALAQTIGYVNRARAFMPPGTVGPFIMRFDAGTVPVGYLVFSSESRSLGEIQDLALNRVRPQFATLPGLTSPPPFGGSQRTIVIRVDPDRLRSYGMSPDEVIRAVTTGNVIMPSGSVNIGDETRISPMNSVVTNINDLLELPIRTGAGPPVSIRDVGSVSDSTDIPTAYALVNGRRAVYIPVTKRPNASTLSVVSEVKANLGRFQALVPDDIKVSYELDQSRNVSASLQAVLREAAIGALLTGLMVLVFLRDWRSAGIVVVTIPFALLAAVIALWGAGQTINVMTLGGLALAVGILVDEATVAIENIHTHLARGVSGRARCPRRERRSRRAASARHALRGRRVRPVVLHDGRVALALRPAVARRRLLDDRVLLPLELARAGPVGLAPRWTGRRSQRPGARGRLGRSASEPPGPAPPATGARAAGCSSRPIPRSPSRSSSWSASRSDARSFRPGA